MKNKTTEEQQKHFEMLCDVKKILDFYKCTNILTGSALLGIYRDGELRSNCLGVTLSCFYDQVKPVELKIINELIKYKFKIERHFINRNWKIRASKGRLQIEICGYSAMNFHYYRFIKRKMKIIPKTFFDNLTKLKFKGVKFNVPKDIEGYLKFVYNDWKTPVDKQISPSLYKSDKHMVVKK